MGAWKEAQIEMAALSMATDQDLCRIFQMQPAQLERYRGLIESARARALVALKNERAKSLPAKRRAE